MLKKTLLAASLAAVSASALADHGSHYYSPDMATKMKHYESVSSTKNIHAQHDTGFSYDYFDLSYALLNADGADADSVIINFSSALNDNYHLKANYTIVGDDEFFRTSVASVGAGLHTAIDHKTDFFADALIGQSDTETSIGDFDATTLSATVGVRGKITPDSEYKASITHGYAESDGLSDTENSLSLEYQKHLSEKANLILGLQLTEDITAIGGGVRFYF